VKLTTIKSVLSIVAAFLHGDLEDTCMMQPQEYIMSDKEHLVCKLKKNLYGLKQAPRQRYLKFDKFMASNGYKRLQAGRCLYLKYFENSYIILLLYVNDMLVAGSSMKKIVNLKAQLARNSQ